MGQTAASAAKTRGESGPLAILCEGVSFTYPGADAPALENVTLRVPTGERLGILGPNGGGKSTLLSLILGLQGGHTGRIEVLGMSPGRARAAGTIAYVAQRTGLERAMPLSVRQAVTLGAAWREPPWRGAGAEARARVEAALDLVGAGALAERPIGKLSGGELQRALIARALAARPRILLLDEPAVGIDVAGQRLLAELLERIRAGMGVTTVVVSHDLRAIAAGSDRVACLARRLHSHVSPAGLTPQVLAEVFSHDVAGLVGLEGRGVHVHAHEAGGAGGTGGGGCAQCHDDADGARGPEGGAV